MNTSRHWWRESRPVAAIGVGVLLLLGGLVPSAAFADATDGSSGATAQDQHDQEIEATGQQDTFNLYLVNLLNAYPYEVIDFAWHGDYGSVLVDTTTAEAAASDLADYYGIRVSVRVSAEDLVAYNDRARVELAAMDLLYDVADAPLGARYEPETNSVIVTAWTDSPGNLASEFDKVVANSESLGLLQTLKIEYESSAEIPELDSTTQGGEAYGTCTGGFIGNRGSTYGILTASHCTTKPSTYDGATAGTTYVASGNVDIRYTTLSGGTPENKFYYGSGYRTITAQGIVSTGSLLYKYGRTTGYGSDVVESYKGCVAFSNGATYCNLYYTKNAVTSGGDSGGPWFVANTGYGFTTGHNSGGSYLTPIAWVSSLSGGTTVKKG